jgi:hypothetical protein
LLKDRGNPPGTTLVCFLHGILTLGFAKMTGIITAFVSWTRGLSGLFLSRPPEAATIAAVQS